MHCKPSISNKDFESLFKIGPLRSTAGSSYLYFLPFLPATHPKHVVTPAHSAGGIRRVGRYTHRTRPHDARADGACLSAVGPLAPQQLSLAHCGAGGRCAAPCARSHVVLCPPPPPTSLLRAGPLGGCVHEPLRLAATFRCALHAVCRPLGAFAARARCGRCGGVLLPTCTSDLISLSYAASFPLAPSLVCRPASTLRPPSCTLLMV